MRSIAIVLGLIAALLVQEGTPLYAAKQRTLSPVERQRNARKRQRALDTLGWVCVALGIVIESEPPHPSRTLSCAGALTAVFYLINRARPTPFPSPLSLSNFYGEKVIEVELEGGGLLDEFDDLAQELAEILPEKFLLELPKEIFEAASPRNQATTEDFLLPLLRWTIEVPRKSRPLWNQIREDAIFLWVNRMVRAAETLSAHLHQMNAGLVGPAVSTPLPNRADQKTAQDLLEACWRSLLLLPAEEKDWGRPPQHR